MGVPQTYDMATLSEVQSAELVILDEVARICERHDLTWFLDAGTVLGAVRHGGFIPWDDDVDVSLLRDDYERFLKIAPRELPGWLRLDTPAENKRMSCLFSKVCLNGSVFATQETIDAGYDQGVFVDIFAYDLVAEDPEMRQRQMSLWKRATYLKYLYYSGNVNVFHNGVLGYAEHLACKLAHAGLMAFSSVQHIEDMMSEVRAIGREYARDHDPLVTLDYGRKPVRMSAIVPCGSAEFAGKRYPVPGKTEDFLVNTYGEWHMLPPEEKRHTHKPLAIEFPEAFQ